MSEPIKHLGCPDLPTEGGCCMSCHDDYDGGYDEPTQIREGDTVWYFCCAGVRAWEKLRGKTYSQHLKEELAVQD